MADIEKNDHTEQLERIRTEDASSTGESLEQIQTHETIAKVDIHNKQAFKGDESDGKISWGPRKWIAALSLAMLYTGRSRKRPTESRIFSDVHHRLPGSPLLRWRYTVVHRGGHRKPSCDRMASSSQHAGNRCGGPVHGLPAGLVR